MSLRASSGPGFGRGLFLEGFSINWDRGGCPMAGVELMNFQLPSNPSCDSMIFLLFPFLPERDSHSREAV